MVQPSLGSPSQSAVSTREPAPQNFTSVLSQPPSLDPIRTSNPSTQKQTSTLSARLYDGILNTFNRMSLRRTRPGIETSDTSPSSQFLQIPLSPPPPARTRPGTLNFDRLPIRSPDFPNRPSPPQAPRRTSQPVPRPTNPPQYPVLFSFTQDRSMGGVTSIIPSEDTLQSFVSRVRRQVIEEGCWGSISESLRVENAQIEGVIVLWNQGALEVETMIAVETERVREWEWQRVVALMDSRGWQDRFLFRISSPAS